MTDQSQMPADGQQKIDSDKHSEDASFLIVGIGASAGGLDAFQKFFSALPDDPDMAFVLIQHLDPTHESMMPDLLSRHTGLRVMQVKKQTKVEKNTVYIIPPGKYLGFKDNSLVLSDPPESRGMRMAIDFFFKTLAEHLREKAICIVLTGTGSDGTMGLREVKANGGLAIVQDPDTAQHDGMPRSAIRTGAVDRILAPEAMAPVLLEYAEHPYVNGVNKGSVDTADENEDLLEKILVLLYAKTGHEFKHYKRNTLSRRIQRRMSLNHIGTARDYLNFLRDSKKEADELFKDLLINVTAFFREAEAWETLNEIVIPRLIDRCDGSHPIRVWAPGCASGEETYSIAMLLHEALDKNEKRCDIQIFGTDIDKDAFQIARIGRYPESIAAQVSKERLARFFNHEDGCFVIKKQIRESVVFAPQSLINDPPFSNQDLIICRNLMIYLTSETQHKVVRLFHFALKEDGFLFLGNSESIGSQKELFKPESKTWRIYRRLGSSRLPNIELPVFSSFRGRDKKDTLHSARGLRTITPAGITYEALVKHYAPPAVLIDRNFKIIFYRGDIGAFLKQPEGEPTRNLLEQLSPSIRTHARWLLQNVMETEKQNSVEHGLVLHPDGPKEYVTLEATPLVRPAEANGLILLTFFLRSSEEPESETQQVSVEKEEKEDVTIQQLESELQVTREELQSTIEEMETSNEELKASNEEVMSMNEELQSTNEELETSKEELQSLNEELTTVNNELREKVKELEEANDDMANLLSSTHIPTVFLDRELKIKRFTPSALELMHLVGSDVGRHVDHIVKCFHDPDLPSDIQEVLRDLIPSEKEVETSDEGKWYIRRVLPYRTQDERIAGVVITFVDITQRREYEEALAEKEKILLQINTNLERTVAERTLKIKEKNELLQRMVIELSQVEQRERRKLASTLHDNLQQLIASARFRLDTYASKNNKKKDEILSQIRQLLVDAAQASRDVTANLAPPVLYDAGLLKALGWMCSNFKENHDLNVSCSIPEYDREPFNQDTSVFIFQSVKELLFNVVKHSGSSNAELNVTVDLHKLWIQVVDKGSGFNVKEREQEIKKKGGYGLLSIQQRMAYVGGEMKIDSEPGKGTRVEISLPFPTQITASEEEVVRNDTVNTVSKKPEAGSKLNILLVDDHQLFREGVKSLLEGEADLVVIGEASNGEEAVEKSSDLKPDVILMDINMPKMNGIEATRRIKADMPQIRVIGLSVHVDEDISKTFLSAGADAYLPKGGDPDKILDEIRKN